MSKLKKQVSEFIQKLRAFSQNNTASAVGTVSMNGYTVTVEERDGRSVLTVKTPNGTASARISGGFSVSDMYGSSSTIGDGKNRVEITKNGILLNGTPLSLTPTASSPSVGNASAAVSVGGAPVPSPQSTQGTKLPSSTAGVPSSSGGGRTKTSPHADKPFRAEKDKQVLFGRKAEEEQKRKEEEEKHVEEVTSMELPMDWENLYADDERATEPSESISDGFIRCLNTLGRVDIEYISAITGRSLKEVITELKGAIYQNPMTWGEVFYHGWETADEYLSGNLLTKYRIAKEANEKYRGYFEDNVTALKRLLPPAISTDDIYVSLGSPWLPATVVDDFIAHLSGIKDRKVGNRTIHDEVSGLWRIPNKNRFNGYRFGNYRYEVKSTTTYGTLRMNMLSIIEHTLNMRTIAIKDKVRSDVNKSGESLAINERETVLALEKQALILKEFADWVWTDAKRANTLRGIYESRYGSIRKRHFDGTFLALPEINPAITLYPYQKNAIARILFTPNSLLAHDVGSGKTFVMIAAGMELRRMGISEKNLYVVPNNLVGQWQAAFATLYPKAKLLVIEPKHFTPDRRNGALRAIQAGDYDAALMAASCFDAIPLSRGYYENLESETVRSLRRSESVFASAAGLEVAIKSAKKTYEKLKEWQTAEQFSLAFDDLGIGTLFVDEAHNYKNVPIYTGISHINGISRGGSMKCRGMMDKCGCVQKQNDGRGVVMATGTPITNSITDIFIMQKYLQSGELALLGLHMFDSWVGMFAEKATEFEIGVDTSSYRLVTRFSRFHNLPELTAILASVADFHKVDREQDGIPEFLGYTDTVIKPSTDFVAYLKSISARADDVKNRRVRRRDDNMLKITTDGRKAALDLRLVDGSVPYSYETKAARCAENVCNVYRQTMADKSAQLIFCDTSTPKADFNMYDEMARLLILGGIPANAIAYVHDATTERKRDQLFAAVRAGEIRVLIGSSFKLGLGVNVQERLIAIHHLDVPWRPADMVQREGRILRQGNTCDRVFIFRYITEGSFDAYSWQLLETKQRFITQLLSGSLSDRLGGDVDSTVLSYAEVKALAVGNPLVKKRVEISNELDRFCLLQRSLAETKERMQRELAELAVHLAKQKKLIAACEADLAFVEAGGAPPVPERAEEIRDMLTTAFLAYADKPVETELCEYRGFRLSVPPYVRTTDPSLIVRREGEYRLPLGAEGGFVRRLDRFVDEFAEQLKNRKDVQRRYNARKRVLTAELAKDDGYAEEIESRRRQIEEIDKELGIEKPASDDKK